MRYLFKYTGILAVVLCLSLLGFIKSRLKREEIKRLKALEAAFSRADGMLLLGNKSRAEILSECFGCVLKNGEIEGQAEGITNTFLKEFGSGDTALERSRIAQTKKEIASLALAAEKQYSQLSGIWRTAGVCGGLAAGIMLI